MKKFIINLTESELQTVLNALAKEPYIQVFELINNIQIQASEQLEEQKQNP